MKSITGLALSVVLGVSAISCRKSSGGHDSAAVVPEEAFVGGTVTYDGSANPLGPSTRELVLMLFDAHTEEGIAVTSFDVPKRWLEDSYPFDFPFRFDPGRYFVMAYWNVEDDDTFSKREPQGVSQDFDLRGGENAWVDIILQDQVSATDLGRVEGNIGYTGVDDGDHHLYVAVRDVNYRLIRQAKVSLFLVSKEQLMGRGFSYIVTQVPPGELYRVTAYWDVNDNQIYDDGPAGEFRGFINVSPGLGELRVDIQLED